MVKALAPRLRRGSPWVWLWIVISSLVVSSASAQTGDTKPASKGETPKGKEAPATKKAETKAVAPATKADATKAASPAAEPADEDGPRRDSGEIFKDPRVEKVMPNTFAQLAYPSPRPAPTDATQIKAMAAGQIPADRALLTRYIDMQLAELTNHTNIRALIDPPPTQQPTSAAARAIERASDALIAPLTAARSQQPPNNAFLAAYVPLLQAKLPPLLDNHLIARIQASIVLGMVSTTNTIDLLIKQLKDPNQVIWVKLWAARGVTNATQTGGLLLEAQKGAQTAIALLGVLENESDLPWPVEIRLLEALGSNRLASTSAIDRKADVLSVIAEVLTDKEARPDVRAWAAWASGMVQVGATISKVNYPILTYHIGDLAAEIGDKIGAEYDALQGRFEKNKGPATYLTGLLISQVEPALSGVATARGSGIINIAHPSAEANKPYAQTILTQVRAVGKAAVELLRAGGTLQAEARKTLAARVAELRGALAKNPPKDVELTPGGLKLPTAPAQVVGGRPAK